MYLYHWEDQGPDLPYYCKLPSGITFRKALISIRACTLYNHKYLVALELIAHLEFTCPDRAVFEDDKN